MVEVNSNHDQSSTEQTMLRQTTELISSLLPLSKSIKPFAAKWQSIRNKLEELLSNLKAIEAFEHTDKGSFSITLESVLATLKKCDELAKQCMEISYGGKLLMQSDLSIVSAKLDDHVKSVHDVYAMGMLMRSHAVVVSRPSASASTDDVRFHVVDLLSRFKVGRIDMKKQALVAFNEAIQEDDRYVEIALELDGFLNFLIDFLGFNDSEIQEKAAKAVSLIAGFQPYRSLLISAGIIAPLIRVLESGNGPSKEFAARCLMKVTENSDNAWSVSAYGGVTALLKICGDCDGEMVRLACGVLKNLVGVEEIKRFMVDEGAITLFVNLAKSKDEAIKICSFDLLQTIAHGDESIREMIIQEGGIRAFVRIWDPKSPFSTKAKEAAFRGIVSICCSSENSLNLLMNYGFMNYIFYFLRYGEVEVQELVLNAAFWLSGISEEGKKMMGDAGFMPVVAKFLDSKSFEIQEMAAEIISSMIIVPKNRKRFMQNDHNVGNLMQMLEANSGNKKLLLSILMSLMRSNSGRKKIANSGHMKNIEKLAEAEVLDAKRIVKKLSSNRIGSTLSGLWHS